MLTEAELTALSEELKDYLQITWSDAPTDKKIAGFIIDGESYLNEVAGNEINYVTDLKAKQLLKDYGRYVYNHSFELFEVNFRRELLKLSIREGAKAHAKADSETST